MDVPVVEPIQVEQSVQIEQQPIHMEMSPEVTSKENWRETPKEIGINKSMPFNGDGM